MIISHNLNDNGYLINNDVYLNLSADRPLTYFRVSFKNITSNLVSHDFVSYVDFDKKASLKIDAIIKAMMLDHLNSSSFKITIETDNGFSINITKNFVRGGIRNNEINNTIQPNSVLRISERLPYWSGFPIYENKLNENYEIVRVDYSDINGFDRRTNKSLNSIYLRFLNQKGGYSFWLFDSFSEKESARSEGYLRSNDNLDIVNLGATLDTSISLYGKFTKEYEMYARDFMISSDVKIFRNMKWQSVVVRNSNLETDNVKRNFVVNFELDLRNTINPSRIW